MTNLCSIENCNRLVHSRTWCATHYSRYWRYGDPEKVNRGTHHLRYSGEYQAWCHMKTRCTNKNYPYYANYGGRGVKVCDKWLNSFECFYADMGKRPSSQHSLDRINNNGNYEPGNCRWATAKEQANNTRRNHLISFNGKTKTLAEWCELTGLRHNTVLMRLKYGWSAADILTPVRKRG